MRERPDAHESPVAPTRASVTSSVGVKRSYQLLGKPATLSRRAMGSEGVLALQRSAGNRATASLLSPKPVQRFPATALSAPTKWSDPAPDVFRPGEGVSGGIYILTSPEADAEIKKVVVKPVFGGTQNQETGEQLEFGDRILSFLGINAPVSRVVRVGTPEYQDILSIVRPHQPPRPKDGGGDFWEISEARSFVVMSEVPNARSAKSFAEKAATDAGASKDLFNAVFADTFIRNLAWLAVGDLLIGNPDRITLGKANLGNLMISVQQGKASLHAIDTAAILPKARSPKEILDKGGYGGGFFQTKTNLDNPDAVAEDFYKFLIGSMRDATDPAATQPAWETFEQTYTDRHDEIVKTFRGAWDGALFNVFALVNTKLGRHQMKAMTEGYAGTAGEENLSYTNLKANAMYLAGRSEGKTHEQSAGGAAGYLAYKQLTSLSASDFEQTAGLRPWLAGYLGRDAVTANLPTLAGLPKGQEINNISRIGAANYFGETEFKAAMLKVESARQSVMDLGTKRSGGRDVTRNRVQAGNYIANSYLELLGARQASYFLCRLAADIEKLSIVAGGNLSKEKRQHAADVGEMLLARRTRLERTISDYGESLEHAAETVKKIKKYREASDLSTRLAGTAAAIEKDAKKVGSEIDGRKPADLIKTLRM